MPTLRAYLDAWAQEAPDRGDVAAIVLELADACVALAGIIAAGPAAGNLGAVIGDSLDGDGQKVLDMRAHALFVEALRQAPVAAVASEEAEEAIALHPGARIVVALDPLDGSNNIETGAPMGTVFSLLPADGGADGDPFRQPGTRQLAGGFVLYGPYVAMALTVGDGAHVFVLDPGSRHFDRIHAHVRVPPARREYAINAANRRHWPLPVRAYIEECVAGSDGPRGVDYNTRWIGCVVAEAYRVLLRGGIYLYPGDSRKGYARGRLRLLYEAAPIALVFEAAGGVAVDGIARILDLVPMTLHQRVPLIFGSVDKVERVVDLHHAGVPPAGQRPLFAARGLFHT